MIGSFIIAAVSSYLFAVVFFLLGFLFASILSAAEESRRTIRCRCGDTVARDAIIVDPSDVDRIADTLTENCPACRQARRSANPEWSIANPLSSELPHVAG